MFDEAFAGLVADANRFFMEEMHFHRMIGLLHLMEGGTADETEIGYVIHRDFRRRGYASGAVLEMLKEQSVRQVKATAYLFNTSSRMMFEKLGFEPCGTVEKKDPQWNEQVYRKML